MRHGVASRKFASELCQKKEPSFTPYELLFNTNKIQCLAELRDLSGAAPAYNPDIEFAITGAL